MAAARVALALGFVAAATQPVTAEPCAPRAELGGDATAVAQVAAELQRLGIDASTDPRQRVATQCPVIVAAVELDRSGGIAVAVRDASQRSEGRVVSDAALAAAWIDSWLRDDFSAGSNQTQSVSARPVETLAAAPVVSVTPVPHRFSFAASYLHAWSDDDTTWSGVALASCVRVDGFCLGARAGYARQNVTADLTAAYKRDLSVLATASYPQTVGRLSVVPELGLGVGQRTISRVDGCGVEPQMCDPTDAMCNAAPPPSMQCSAASTYVGDNFSATTYTPRASAAMHLAVPLFEHVWLDGLAAVTYAPFGHTGDYATAPTTSSDPNMMPGPATVFPLPGDSVVGFELGVGLRVGVP